MWMFIVLYVPLVCLVVLSMLVHWCTGLVDGFVALSSLCRSNSKTALIKLCAFFGMFGYMYVTFMTGWVGAK